MPDRLRGGSDRRFSILPRLGALWGAVLAAALGGCLPPRSFSEHDWKSAVEDTRTSDLYAHHVDEEGRYFNPWMPQDRSVWAFWRWVLSSNSTEAYAKESGPASRVPNTGDYLLHAGEPSTLTHVGHATFAVQWGGQVVVTDPFFSHRAAVVARLVPPAFGPDRVPEGAVVLISHNHYDHLDADSVEVLADRVTFLCPLGIGDYLRKLGAVSVRELDWWESSEIGGTRFTALPAQHWSRRFRMGTNETLWCSWMLERGGSKIYYGADSGYFKGFREYGRRFPGIEVALLGIGAYEPRWFMHYAHMNIPEVLRAFEDLGAGILVPTQWGVLELGDEPAGWPAVELRRAVEQDPALRDRVSILPVGGRLVLP